MRKIKNLWIILAVLIGVVLCLVASFLFKHRSLVRSFMSDSEERVNVLILGKGGVGHEAPDLTDTIMLASVSNSGVKLISLPRDIWVAEIRAKLNSAYYWGKQKNEGFKLVDSAVTEITGQVVNYNLVIDFSIFKTVVDSLGGIEVDVQNSFVDNKYPIAGRQNDLCDGDKTYACRYETIEFKTGKQLMDGETSLKFVRSRNAEGDEGTDFARESRQQLVISSIKNKALSPQVLLNPWKIKSLWNVTMDSIETDIPQEVQGAIIRKVLDSRENVNSVVVPEEMLVNPPTSSKYDRQYVFIPKDGDWKEIQKWVTSVLN